MKHRGGGVVVNLLRC